MAAGSACRSGLNSTAPASPAWNTPSPHWAASRLASNCRYPRRLSSRLGPSRRCAAAASLALSLWDTPAAVPAPGFTIPSVRATAYHAVTVTPDAPLAEPGWARPVWGRTPGRLSANGATRLQPNGIPRRLLLSGPGGLDDARPPSTTHTRVPLFPAPPGDATRVGG